MCAKSYDLMNRQELLAELRRLKSAGGMDAHGQGITHNLTVANEELKTQIESLRLSRKEMEASRDRYNDLYDFAPISYLTLDPNGVIIQANLTACGMLAIERSRLVGLPLLGRVTPEDRLLFLEHMRRARATNTPTTSEVRVVGKHGEVVPVQLTSRPVRDDGEIAFRTTLTDLSGTKWAADEIRKLNEQLEDRVVERTAELETALQSLRDNEERLRTRSVELEKAAVELKMADQRKDDFLAMLGHELRNPLGPIRSAIEMLRIDDLPAPERQEMHEIIERQVIHMVRIVDDLLDVSRISRGKILLNYETANLSKLIRQTADDFRAKMKEAGISLSVKTPEKPLWCLGDPTRLTQILGNLLSNAAKFTDRGGVVTVELTADAAGKTGVITVTDTGIGMDPDILNRLFQPFSQADRSLDRTRGGIGLGLALVKGLVEMHSGHVTATSDGPEKGSQFVIDLPLCTPPAESETHPDAEGSARSLRILVIDDRRDAAVTMRELLRLMGHEAAFEIDGESGLRKAREMHPDIIFSDIGLPRMDGYQVARAVREDPELSSTFLVAVSGYGKPEDQRRAIESGFNHHLTKPVGIDQLQVIIAGVTQSA